MRLLKYIPITIIALSPLLVSAQTFPSFPMAFWGNVTINGDAAPVGTVVNAYYSSTLAGTVTVQDAGVYGYTDPTKQKLIIGEGTGPITFTFQSPSFNSGAETGGTTAITYPQFTSGSTTEDDLAFTVSVPTSAPVSSGGGCCSGGGGGGYVTPTPTTTTSTTASTTAATSTTTSSQTSTSGGVVLGATTYNFTQNLTTGSTGQDVTQLQTILITEGDLTIAAPTGYFGALTKAAVIKYQTVHNISPQSGYVGPLTRTILNKDTTPSTSESTSTGTGSTLTTAQIQAIIGLLQSFGADATTISNVRTALNGSH